MENEIDGLLNRYEGGTLSRRELIAGLGALALLGGHSAVAQEGSPFRANGVNHIALNVPNVPETRDFYVKHLGMKVTRDGPTSCFLTCDNNFVALFRSSEAGLNHYCLSVDGYTVDSAREKLDAAGLEPRVEGQRIYFKDNNGLSVQLSADDHTA